ncbi:MAG: hypothetical protein L3K26_08425, partial [Candidatus Hydrogenedentes bacterium]|nr:hypothetical protein [Candidatus Hydrogenedentota bacterium]
AALLKLLRPPRPTARLAGLIAVDVACYEDFGTRPFAEAALAKAISDPGPLELSMLLTVARINQINALPSLTALLDSPTTSPALAVQAIQVLLSGSDEQAQAAAASSRARYLDILRNEADSVTKADEVMAYLYLLESDALTERDDRHAEQWIVHPERAVRERVHAYLRQHVSQACRLIPVIWRHLLDTDSKLNVEQKMQLSATLMAIEEKPSAASWGRLLARAEPSLLRDIIRSWRQYADHPVMVKLLADQAPAMADRVPACNDDLSTVLEWIAMVTGEQTNPPVAEAMDREVLSRSLQATGLEQASPLLGYRVFERVECTKCHLSDTSTSLLGPSLEGVGKDRDIAYFVESVLYPSKVIKTGYETELIETVEGEVLSGRVQEEGDQLRVITPNQEFMIAKKDIESRESQNISLMPEGLAEGLSQGELLDLMAYLASLQ